MICVQKLSASLMSKKGIHLVSRRQFLAQSAIVGLSNFAPSVVFGQSDAKHKLLRAPQITDVRFLHRDQPKAAYFSRAYAQQFQLQLPDGAPQLRAYVQTPKSAQDLIKWAVKTNTPFALRSGGHCFMGFSLHEIMVIDVTELNHIKIDENARTVTVGAGVRLGSLAKALAEKGFVLAHGTHSSVGMAGHTLGGGFGHRCRQDGLLCDQLEWVEMVTASGDLVRASLDENADLFWALRGGGGGQFGLVTQMKFRLQKSAKKHLVQIYIPMDALRASEAIIVWQFLMSQAARHTSLHALVTKRGEGALFQLTGMAGGDFAIIEKLVKDILRQTSPLDANAIQSGMEAQITLTALGHDFLPEANLLTHSHLYENFMQPDQVAQFMDSVQQNPSGYTIPNFECWGGAVSDIADDATAFAHRKAQFVVHVQSNVNNEDARAEFVKASEEMRSIFATGATGGTYVNYPDLKLKNWAQSYWGENLPRLLAIKQRWDPTNVFDHAHSLARI